MRRNALFIVLMFSLMMFVLSQQTVLARESEGQAGADICVYGMLKRIPPEAIMLVIVLALMSLSSFCIAINLSFGIRDARKNLIRRHFSKLADRKKAGPNGPASREQDSVRL